MLPRRNLDDKGFHDILGEASVRARAMFPEWSNFNPSDPGLTLLELMAWLTEMQRYHLNRTHPETLEVLLGLLGGHIQKTTPASALVSVTAQTETALPSGTGLDAQGVSFETVGDTALYPHQINAFFTRNAEGQFTPPEPPPESGRGVLMLPCTSGAAFYLCFDRSLPTGVPFRIYFDIRDVIRRNPALAGFDPCLAVTRWEAMGQNGYFGVSVLSDETQDFLYPGILTLLLEQTTEPRRDAGLEGAHVLRVTLEQCSYESPRTLTGVYLNPVSVRQTRTLRHLPVAKGNGMPRQSYRLNLTPPVDSECVELAVNGQLWTRVDRLGASGPNDAHYLLNAEQGRVSFGDGQRGLCPEGDISLRRIALTRGAGGNVKAGAIDRFDSIPGLSVREIRPATGGTDAGTVQEALADTAWRDTHQAVTAEDYEALTLATPGLSLRRVRAFAGADNENTVVVTAQPAGDRGDAELNEGYRAAIVRYLDRFRLLTTRVQVVSPSYIYIDVTLEAYGGEQGTRQALRKAASDFFSTLGFGAPALYTGLYAALDVLCGGIISLSLTPASAAGSRTPDGGIAPPPHGLLLFHGIDARIHR